MRSGLLNRFNLKQTGMGVKEAKWRHNNSSCYGSV